MFSSANRPLESPHREYTSDDTSMLLSKSADAVTQEIKALKSAIVALNPDPQEAQATSKQLDDIAQLLSPVSVISEDVARVSDSIRRWDTKWHGQAPATGRVLITNYMADQESRDVLNWLSPLNFWTKQNDTFSRKAEGTGQWLFEDPAFNRWLAGTERMLCCAGMRMSLDLPRRQMRSFRC